MLEIIYHTGIIMYMYNVDHTMYTVFIVCESHAIWTWSMVVKLDQ